MSLARPTVMTHKLAAGVLVAAWGGIAGPVRAQGGAAVDDGILPLLLITGLVVAAVLAGIWFASRSRRHISEPKAPTPEQAAHGGTAQQAAAAFAAFEKAKLVGQKAQQAKAAQIGVGEEASDEHPS